MTKKVHIFHQKVHFWNTLMRPHQGCPDKQVGHRYVGIDFLHETYLVGCMGKVHGQKHLDLYLTR